MFSALPLSCWLVDSTNVHKLENIMEFGLGEELVVMVLGAPKNQ
jgi:hypothetical protein